MRSHSSINHGVYFDLSALDISACRTSKPIQRQSKISSRLIRRESLERPMNTEHSSCSAPVASNCAWYSNLNKNRKSQRIPSSSYNRRRVATSMLSDRRGWLQQLFDQYSGQSRLDGERCWRSNSPRSLKISRENARCRTPRPSWHSALLRDPSRQSASSTRIKASESAIIPLLLTLYSCLDSSMTKTTSAAPPGEARKSVRHISRPIEGARPRLEPVARILAACETRAPVWRGRSAPRSTQRDGWAIRGVVG